jgi:hypothetical protein
VSSQSIFNLFFILLFSAGCGNNNTINNLDSLPFPPELVDFRPYEKNPVFTGTGKDTWDRNIRERGYILYEDSIYKMWYTGYNGDKDPVMYLGYATSTDGLTWMRYAGNPIFNEYWTEDVHIVKMHGTYYMAAEGVNDIAHFLTSTDGIRWYREGDLDIRKVNGSAISSGAYGTPTLWVEEGKWYLFYEREDLGIWLAVSMDQKMWTNVQDDPVIIRGPEAYDEEAVALDQIIKYQGRYYAYYHASPDKNWQTWNSNVAVSEDLIHWVKYSKNPIAAPDSLHKDISSPILVNDGRQYRLYTMHDGVRVYFPKNSTTNIQK